MLEEKDITEGLTSHCHCLVRQVNILASCNVKASILKSYTGSVSRPESRAGRKKNIHDVSKNRARSKG